MSQGSRITAKWHAIRYGKPQEAAEQKEDYSIRGKIKARHEAVYGKPKTREESPEIKD